MEREIINGIGAAYPKAFLSRACGAISMQRICFASSVVAGLDEVGKLPQIRAFYFGPKTDPLQIAIFHLN